MSRLFSIVGLWALVVVLQACAARRPPTAMLSSAELAMRRASDQGAAEHAPLDVHLAREKLDGARESVADKDYSRAERYAEQARIDAEAAEAKTRALKAEEGRQQRIRGNVEQPGGQVEGTTP